MVSARVGTSPDDFDSLRLTVLDKPFQRSVDAGKRVRVSLEWKADRDEVVSNLPGALWRVGASQGKPAGIRQPQGELTVPIFFFRRTFKKGDRLVELG